MIRAAVKVGCWSAALAFFWLVTQPAQPRCVPLAGQAGAVVCGGRVGEAAVLAAPLHSAATVETILADPLPTPNNRAPLPTWLPAGVLSWEPEIRAAAGRVGLDPLVLAIIVSIECPSGNAACGSYMGARGLTQFMPGTADAVAIRSGLPCAERTDGQTSLNCGAYHFVELLSMCGSLWTDGREANAIACAGAGYSAGPGYIPVMKSHVGAGGDPRTAAIPEETRRWVTLALDMWRRAGRQ